MPNIFSSSIDHNEKIVIVYCSRPFTILAVILLCYIYLRKMTSALPLGPMRHGMPNTSVNPAWENEGVGGHEISIDPTLRYPENVEVGGRVDMMEIERAQS